MGLYVSVYAAAGFKIKELTEWVTIKKEACEVCKTSTKDNFCGECGGKVGLVDIENKLQVRLDEITGNDNLCRDYQSDTHMTVYSNMGNETIQIEANEQISISPELISERISDF